MTKIEETISQILNSNLKSGCDKKTLIDIRDEIITLLSNSKDKSPIEIIEPVIYDIKKASSKFLHQHNLKGVPIIYGLSSSIYIHGKNNYEIYFEGGYTHYDEKYEIMHNTIYDVASITKLYTLVCKDKLVEQGYFEDSDKLSDIIPEFGNTEDFTLEDLSLMVGELRTNYRVDSAATIEEAIDILKTIYVYSDDRQNNKYTDLGAILTAIAITKKYNELNGTDLSFADILNDIIFEKYEMNDTCFNPHTIAAGTGNSKNIVHDPKARILGGVCGASGLFTSTRDQVKFARAMFNGNNENYDSLVNPISPKNIKKYGTITFPNSVQSNKGHFGLYVKNKEHAKSLCPRDYSNGTFTAQGYTGSSVIFDPVNGLHNGILVGAIRPDLYKKLKDEPDFRDYIINEKANGFIEADHTYQDSLTRATLILNAIKKYLDLYESKNNEVKIYINIK